MPFVDMVFDKPSGNAMWGILSIGKYDLSLRIPFTLLVSNVIHTYETLGNEMAGLTTEYTKDKYNVKIIERKVSPKVSPTTYVGRRIKERRCEGDEQIIIK
jgi:hypothetical protein